MIWKTLFGVVVVWIIYTATILWMPYSDGMVDLWFKITGTFLLVLVAGFIWFVTNMFLEKARP